jgi:hypothetical protein
MQLRRNAISAWDATLISIAGTAPANTIATSTATLIAGVGLSGPAQSQCLESRSHTSI